MLLRAYIAAQLRKDEGATAIEYALLVSLIAIVMVAALLVLGPKIASIFNNAATTIK
jgi:pilus assembly protein Flp/PilA